MTNRRDRLPEEFRSLHPEEFIDIYETDDGRLIAPTPKHVASLIDVGQYAYAYAMMRYHLQTEAMKALRADGCKFPRYERLWLADFDEAASDGAKGLAALIEDAGEFVTTGGSVSPKGASALERLLALKWQAAAIAEADTEAGRESLRRMALVAAALGFETGQAGVTGAIPELESLRKIVARTVKVKEKQADAAEDTARVRRDKWHPQALAIARFVLADDPFATDETIVGKITDEAGVDGFEPKGERQIRRALALWRAQPEDPLPPRRSRR